MKYQHYKTGDIYTVLYHGVYTVDNLDVVVYRSSRGPDHVWVRPADEFYGWVEMNGRQVRRFNPQNG